MKWFLRARRAIFFGLLLAALLSIPSALQAEAEQPRIDPGGDKVLYLTFDDGPSPYTQAILDVLARHNAKATFFMLGRQASGRPEMVQAIFDSGHGVANHTYNHPALSKLGKQRFDDEVLATASALGGRDHGCLRPPYGASSAAVRANAQALGYNLVTWTIDPRDWARPGAAAIASRVISKAHPGGVVVMHDGGGDRTQTVAALETILTELGAQGYRFAPLCREGVVPYTPNQQVQPLMGPDGTPKSNPAAEPTPEPPTDPSTLATGGITSPQDAAAVQGVVAIVGEAQHPTFRKWQLDLLLDGSQETFLAFGEAPAPAGSELLQWDTTLYPNGDHLLRLRVVYEGLNYKEYTVRVKVDN